MYSRFLILCRVGGGGPLEHLGKHWPKVAVVEFVYHLDGNLIDRLLHLINLFIVIAIIGPRTELDAPEIKNLNEEIR